MHFPSQTSGEAPAPKPFYRQLYVQVLTAILLGITVGHFWPEVGASLNAGQRLLSGGGYVVRAPAIDLAEIGAGGGSLAWIDAGGALRVGPRSAGAVPAP